MNELKSKGHSQVTFSHSDYKASGARASKGIRRDVWVGNLFHPVDETIQKQNPRV